MFAQDRAGKIAAQYWGVIIQPAAAVGNLLHGILDGFWGVFLVFLSGMGAAVFMLLKFRGKAVIPASLTAAFTFSIVGVLKASSRLLTSAYVFFAAALVCFFFMGFVELKKKQVPAEKKDRTQISARTGLVFLIILIVLGAGFRLYRLNVHPYGYAGHAAYHALESHRLMQQIEAGTYLSPKAQPWMVSLLKFIYHFGQSIQRVLDMAAFKMWGFGFLSQRLVAVMIGIISITMTMLFTRRLFGLPTALLTTLFFTLSPIHITWSRYSGCMQIQSIPYLIGVYHLLFLAVKRKSYILAILSGALAGTAVFLYSPNFLTPFVGSAFLLYHLLLAEKKQNVLILLCLFLLFTGIVAAPRVVITGGDMELLLDTPFYHKPEWTQPAKLWENIRFLGRQLFIHPRGMHYFLKGSAFNGLATAAALMGILYSFFRIKDGRFVLLLLMTGAGLAPAVFSDGPFPRRYFNVIPPLFILAGYMIARWTYIAGSLISSENIQKKIYSICIFVLLPLIMSLSADTYFNRISAHETDRGYEHRLAGEFIRDQLKDYRVYVSDAAVNYPHIQVFNSDEYIEGELKQRVKLIPDAEFLDFILKWQPAGEKAAFVLNTGDNFNEVRTALRRRFPDARLVQLPDKDTISIGKPKLRFNQDIQFYLIE